MDTQAQSAVTDDQELAKVLAGMNQQAGQPDQTVDATGMQFEETPATDASPTDTGQAEPEAPAEAITETAAEQTTEAAETTEDTASATSAAEEVAPEIAVPELPQLDDPTSGHDGATASPELESIKKNALEELRPLVDKLDLPADEKFDTLLLIIRSTDDQSLVGAAHDAAKAIEDDNKRAQALLDVIKEIDFFANQPK